VSGWQLKEADALLTSTQGRLVRPHLRVVICHYCRRLQVAKGARDFLPEQMSIREQAFAKISAVGGCWGCPV
jgi:hypothetical protein